ncbi:type II toxin-antitoxin system Phd/YefM family antitoxin [Sphingomonas sp.]|uniref:type II toxin-antitoxin system Phd/YefM family antitoxin n=1 Tax=Sphingomonas sp. TaxID=28214 RepID=UPI0035C85C27
MATVFKVDEAQADLSAVIDRALAGEDIVIARAGEPAVKLVPIAVQPRRKRVPGTMKGMFAFDDSFFDPLPEEELRAWEGR